MPQAGKPRPTCPQCGYIHYADPKVAAVVFIEQAGKVLLVRRGIQPEMGKWALPAGYVDYGEDPRLTAVREVREETGLEIDLTRLLEVMFTPPVIVIIYAGVVISGRLQAADDAEAVDWFAPTHLPELGFSSTVMILQRWQRGEL